MYAGKVFKKNNIRYRKRQDSLLTTCKSMNTFLWYWPKKRYSRLPSFSNKRINENISEICLILSFVFEYLSPLPRCRPRFELWLLFTFYKCDITWWWIILIKCFRSGSEFFLKKYTWKVYSIRLNALELNCIIFRKFKLICSLMKKHKHCFKKTSTKTANIALKKARKHWNCGNDDEVKSDKNSIAEGIKVVKILKQ